MMDRETLKYLLSETRKDLEKPYARENDNYYQRIVTTIERIKLIEGMLELKNEKPKAKVVIGGKTYS